MKDNVVSIVKDNLLDLDEYRKRRIEEGSWPPDETTVREYWQSIKNRLKTIKKN